jgi:hypothetical protein
MIRFVSGNYFNRAAKAFIFDIPSGFSRDESAVVPTVEIFSAACSAVPKSISKRLLGFSSHVTASAEAQVERITCDRPD